MVITRMFDKIQEKFNKYSIFHVVSKNYENDVIQQYSSYKILLKYLKTFRNIKNTRRQAFYEVTSEHLTVNDVLHIRFLHSRQSFAEVCRFEKKNHSILHLGNCSSTLHLIKKKKKIR